MLGVSVCLAVGSPTAFGASTDDRIEALQRQIDELKQALGNL